MKSTHLEMEALLAAFQLPGLHSAIPVQANITKGKADASTFARKLLDARIIKPADIPPSVTTADEIIQAGMGAWFRRRTSRLRHVKFHLTLHVSRGANDIMECLYGAHTDCEFKGNPVLVIEGNVDPFYRMDRAAQYLERVFPGLFRSAFDAVANASYRTVDVRMPMELYDHCCYMYWDCDSSEKLSERDARRSLKERFGDDKEVIENYLPSKIRPLFGNKLCHSYWLSKKGRLGNRKLSQFAASTSRPKAKMVALQTIALRKAIDEAERIEARLPDLRNVKLTNINRAATLLFKPHHIVYQCIDDLVNDSYNAGDGTDILGLEELPETVDALILYFKKLDAALNVLRHMDRLIGLISTKLENHHDN